MFKEIREKVESIAFGSRGNKPELSAGETEFLPAVLEVMETPPSPVGRTILWVLFILTTIAIIWSVIGEVDEVAVAPGKVIPKGYVKVVQTDDKGIVKAIHVHEGDVVKAGQVLVELDPTITTADETRLKKQVAGFQLEADRLTAELGQSSFSPVIASYPGIEQRDIDFQVSLYNNRITEHRTKMAAAEAGVGQQQSALQGAFANQTKYAKLLEIARDKEERAEKLLEENAISLFMVLENRSNRLELEQNLAAQTAEISKTQSALAQSLENQANVQAEWIRDINTKLVDTRKQLQAYSEELKKAQEKQRLSTIVAPIDGRVHQLSIHTIGGVVTEAQPLMTIVPEGTEVELEAMVANKDIGFIQEGQKAAVKVDTFSFQKYGTIEGIVTKISPDAIDPKSGKDTAATTNTNGKDGQQDTTSPYYRVTLQLNQDHVDVLGRTVYLSPGMSAQAEIKIRTKKIIEFFLDPFRQYTSEALRER